MTSTLKERIISKSLHVSPLITLASRPLLQLSEKSLAIELGDDAAVHKVGCFFVFEERIGERHAFKLQRYSFLAWLRLARHSPQRCVVTHVEPLTVRVDRSPTVL